MSKIEKYLEEHHEDMLDSLHTLVSAESPSDQKELVDECGLTLQNIARQLIGGNLEVYKQSKRGDHFKITVGNGTKRVLVCAHFDTVWDEGRLPIKIVDNKFYGPGAIDMKGGIIQSLWAVNALQEENAFPNIELTFLFTSDEELGSQTSQELIEQEAQNSDIVLITEPPVAKTGDLKTARKGVGIYNLEIYGKASHAGNHHEAGHSAVNELAHQIINIEKLTNYDIGTTVNVGVVHGGTKRNVVPDHAEALIDFRVKTVEEADRIVQALESLEPVTNHVEIKVTGELNRPPMVKSKATQELFNKAQEAGKEVGLDIGEKLVGGGSDGNFTAILGVPTLDGLGALGDGPHAEHEHIIIDELPKRAAMFANLLKKI
ncbi:M20 family metallopeptidase [Piscibacillus halophilus]|uniref:Glutamate carboxypeptidase n=1 Tax=Piscibacillus halophilus TaxID=571933 RepID=A0A1H9FKB2_9BACI|nr:M20 family metallopeptidase [Piscibacillus halophilus]SEQ38235.1 glutamate carboxypeptidase [Piscibacillus halophilus]